MLRKILVALAASAFGVFLFFMVLTTTTASMIQADKIKGWLSDSGIYSNVVEGALQSVKEQATASTETDVSNIPLQEQVIKDAIAQAFPPDFLQRTTEGAIDGTFRWLNGNVAKPDFSIDFSQAKPVLAASIANHAKDRYNSLPLCARGTLPDTSDVFQIDCRLPAGFNIDSEVQKLTDEIANSKEFFPDTVITAEDIELNNVSKNNASGEPGQPVFEKLKNLPRAYQALGTAPFIFGFLALATAAAVIFGSANKRKGLRHVAIPLIISGLLLLASVNVANTGLARAETSIQQSTTNIVLQKNVIAILKSAFGDLTNLLTRFGIVFVVLALGIFIYLFITRHKATEGKPPKPKDNGSAKTPGIA